MSARKKKPTTKPLKGLPAPDIGEQYIEQLVRLYTREFESRLPQAASALSARTYAMRAVLRRYNEIMGWSA